MNYWHLTVYLVRGLLLIEQRKFRNGSCLFLAQLHRNYTFAPQKEKPASN